MSTDTVKIKLLGPGWSNAATGLLEGEIVEATAPDFEGDCRVIDGESSVRDGWWAYSKPFSDFRYELVEDSQEDQVNHPSHYTQSSIEVIDVIEAFDLDKDGYRKDAVKYILRAPFKGNARQDIEKAIWYLQRWLTRNPEEVAK